jgi:catalase (peroxidase I)
MSDEATENAFAKACAKLTHDEMTIMVRALVVRQAPVESKPKSIKVDFQYVEIN